MFSPAPVAVAFVDPRRPRRGPYAAFEEIIGMKTHFGERLERAKFRGNPADAILRLAAEIQAAKGDISELPPFEDLSVLRLFSQALVPVSPPAVRPVPKPPRPPRKPLRGPIRRIYLRHGFFRQLATDGDRNMRALVSYVDRFWQRSDLGNSMSTEHRAQKMLRFHRTFGDLMKMMAVIHGDEMRYYGEILSVFVPDDCVFDPNWLLEREIPLE
jgi:hypothetical protein